MNLQLFSGIYAILIDLPIKFRANKIKGSIVSECTPFCVDKHVRFLVVWHIEQLSILNFFHVTRIASRA